MIPANTRLSSHWCMICRNDLLPAVSAHVVVCVLLEKSDAAIIGSEGD